MNQPMSLKLKNYLHITALHMITFFWGGDFNMSFSNKNMKDMRDMFELNHLIKDPACFKS